MKGNDDGNGTGLVEKNRSSSKNHYDTTRFCALEKRWLDKTHMQASIRQYEIKNTVVSNYGYWWFRPSLLRRSSDARA